MGLKKGQCNNWRGRPRGSKNKHSKNLRDRISLFLENNLHNVMADIRKMEPKDRVKFYSDLLPYVVPKLTASTMDMKIDGLTEKEKDAMIAEIIERHEQQQSNQ